MENFHQVENTVVAALKVRFNGIGISKIKLNNYTYMVKRKCVINTRLPFNTLRQKVYTCKVLV